MACSSVVKLNAAASSWIAGQQSINRRPGSTARPPSRRASVIRAGSYTDELIKTAVRFLNCSLVYVFVACDIDELLNVHTYGAVNSILKYRELCRHLRCIRVYVLFSFVLLFICGVSTFHAWILYIFFFLFVRFFAVLQFIYVSV